MSEAPQVDLDRLKGMSILLAEDNVTNQLVATQMLETLGAEVDIAADGAIALERLKIRVYDVLLIDIEMPRVSGLDVIRAIRADGGPLAEAPVIALTAYAMQEHREKIVRVGADGLISKPITSIRQFGADILTIMAERIAKGQNSGDAGQALIDRAIYESLHASLGAEAMRELLVRVEIDLATVRDDIADAVASGDCEKMMRASHILIAVAGSVGAVRLQQLAERLCRLAETGDAKDMAGLAEDMLRELERVAGFVTTEQSVVFS